MVKNLAINKENLTVSLLGLLAALATIIAQTSSFACVLWSWEQPKVPSSLLIKE